MRENQKNSPPASRRPFIAVAVVYALWLALLVGMAIHQRGSSL
jgi:hypothetical protein